MATCNANTLLVDARCYAALPANIQRAIALQLWCNVSGGSTPPVEGGGIQNPEAGSSLWNPEADAPIGNPES